MNHLKRLEEIVKCNLERKAMGLLGFTQLANQQAIISGV
jgi:hypothetical protein